MNGQAVRQTLTQACCPIYLYTYNISISGVNYAMGGATRNAVLTSPWHQGIGKIFKVIPAAFIGIEFLNYK